MTFDELKEIKDRIAWIEHCFADGDFCRLYTPKQAKAMQKELDALKRRLLCPSCGGTGSVVIGPPLGTCDGPQYGTCSACGGSGRVRVEA